MASALLQESFLVVKGIVFPFQAEHDELIDKLVLEGRLRELRSELETRSLTQEYCEVGADEDIEEEDQEAREEDKEEEGEEGFEEEIVEDEEEEEDSGTPFLLRASGPRPWPRGIVPFTLKLTTKKSHRAVLRAMKDITHHTGIIYKPHTQEKKYLLVTDTGKGGWSSCVGLPKKDKAHVNLGKGCRSHGKAAHELMHSLGFIHEHNRPDRDEHVTIMWDNLTRRGPFKMRQTYVTPELPYDYKSIMHYGRRMFSKGKTLAIVPRREIEGRLGNTRLSELDVERINLFYGRNDF
ncbi:low choriolytic enzyme-like [Oratosquilla oratoria]|uniref:low choriolytic enzyme-like n=1 Tax=Oratosquilla oratoria TaxID=337810 RepID=UPI003F7771DF